MTDTIANSPERQARIAGFWGRHPDWIFEDVADLVDAELADEAEAAVVAATKTREMTDSFARMTVCPVPDCGGNTLGSRDGLCDSHSRIAYAVRVEREAAQMVNGRTQRQIVEAWLDRKGT